MGIIESIRDVMGFNHKNQHEFASMANGNVHWNPETPRIGDSIQITYRGLLKQHGTNEVYLHYGFDHWNSQVSTIPMLRLENGDFETTLYPSGNQEINFCFKDGASNWDNNYGFNWNICLQ